MVSKANDFLDLLRRRATLIVSTLIVGALSIVALLLVTHPKYQAAAQVMSVGDRSGSPSPIGYSDLPSVATSTAVLSRVVDKLFIADPLSSLQANVKARISNGSQIMSISYQNASPEQAVAVPNAVADEVTRYYEEVSTRQADSEISKLTAAIDAQKQQLQTIGRRLALTQVGGLYSGDDKAIETISGKLDELRVERGLAGAALAGDQAAAQAATSPSEILQKISNSEILQSDAFYKDLATSSAKDNTELAVDRGLYKSDYPGFPGLVAKISAENRTLAAQRNRALRSPDAFSPSREATETQARKAQATVVADRARLHALDALLGIERQRLSDAPRAAASTGYLQLQRDAAHANYLALSGRLSTAIANRSLALGTVVVLDRAVRADAIVVGLSRSKLVALLSFLVLVIALGVAFIAEKADPKLLGPESIEGVYGLPLVMTLKSE